MSDDPTKGAAASSAPDAAPDEERAALHAAVTAAVRAAHAAPVTVDVLEPFEYAKSAPLYTTTIRSGTSATPVVVKDLARAHLLGTAAAVKPAFLHDLHREITMYRHVLPGVAGPATYHGHHSTGSPDHGAVLVIERVTGLELNDVGDVDVWARAAQWLGRFHAQHRTRPAGVPVIVHDTELRGRWHDRAVTAAASLGRDVRSQVLELAELYATRAARHLTSSPVALIHGEFYPSNVIVGDAHLDGGRGPARICPVDWETTGLGPALIDLAALTTGDWEASDRDRVTGAYVHAAAEHGLVFDDFDTDLAACRLQLAIQWLGWFTNHPPPPWQARNWIAEAADAASWLPEQSHPGTDRNAPGTGAGS